MAQSKSILSAGHVIYNSLINDEGVTAITREIYAIDRAEARLPYIFFRRVGVNQRPNTSFHHCDTAEIEIQCCAEQYEGSVALAEAVRSALDGCQHEYGGLVLRSCLLVNAAEDYFGDCFVQQLNFEIKI